DKSVMINKLIEAAADIIDSIHSKRNTRAMSTSSFISEILKRSRATYSMLQLALFYMFRIKKSNPFVNCSRRIFLAALMVASKYLNDKNYKNKAWAKITCLSVTEINTTEMEFLKLIEYQLYVSKPLYDKWVSLLQEHIKKKNT
ncbi:cyclin-domain-containing protein, partial [Thamnidium elegans]